MKIVGFNFSKILAERVNNLVNPSVTNNVTFTNLKKDKLDLLKDEEVLKLSFKYSLLYSNKSDAKEINEEDKDAVVLFEGSILISALKDEAKEFEKSWKKKQVPESKVVPLYNIIFKKCGAKAIPLQDELQIPSPFLKVPQAKVK